MSSSENHKKSSSSSRRDKEAKKHKDKQDKSKSKSKSKKSSKSKKQSEADQPTEFSLTAYTALPVTTSDWKTVSKSDSPSRTPSAVKISDARSTASSSSDSTASPAPSTASAVSRTPSSLDSITLEAYAAQPTTPREQQQQPTSPSNLQRAPSSRRKPTPSMMYGAFVQEELGVLTEPASPTPKDSINLVPSSVSLPHLMGRKMVTQAPPQTYSAVSTPDSKVSPAPSPRPADASAGVYSAMVSPTASCAETGACTPGLGQGSSASDMNRNKPETASATESLGQKTAREYASNNSYAHFFKTDDEIEQEKAKNASNRSTAKPAAPKAEGEPTSTYTTTPYESTVYFTQESEEVAQKSANKKSKKKSDYSDSDSDDSSDSDSDPAYVLPDDEEGKYRVEGLLMRLDKRLRKLESRQRRKRSKADSDSDDDSTPHKALGEQDHLYSKRFQQILEQDDMGKFVTLASLGNDFVNLAETYARIIVSERCLPLEQKSLKPVSIGGAAGGEKFLVRGILFKYAVDTVIGHFDDGEPRYMYGGRQKNDFFAMKAAANELLGLSHMMQYQVPDLSFPLMALIDYCGYRIVAVSTLPINKETIVYGSADAGRTVHNSDPVVSDAMKKLGMHMNLREHLVCDVKIVGAGDIEVHKGLDGRNYVLDFARTFPPEAPRPGENPQSIFYRLLRPELVRQYRIPLSSDAFSGWQMYDPNNAEMNQDVVEATSHLHEEIIANYSNGWMSREFQEFFRSEFCNICDLHRKGINIRHVGRVRAAMAKKTNENDALYLGDMMVRCVKNRLRQTQRDLTDRMKIFAEEPHKMEFLKALNMLTSPSAYPEFWKKEIKELIVDYFGEEALHDHEKQESYSLIESIVPAMRHFLVWRLCWLQGVNLPQHLIADAKKCFAANQEFEFFLEDIADPTVFRPRIKYMALLDFSTAIAGYLRALSQFDSPQRAMSTQRLLNEAKMRMLLATDRITNMATGIFWMAKIYFALSIFSAADQSTNIGRAVFLLKVYRDFVPDDQDAAVLYAVTSALLILIRDDSAFVDAAEAAFKAVDPSRLNEVTDEVALWFRRTNKLRGTKWESKDVKSFVSRSSTILSTVVPETHLQNITSHLGEISVA